MNRARHIGAFLRGYATAKRGQYFPRRDVDARQRSQFEVFKRRVLSRSPFYRPLLDGALDSFPVIDKAAFMAEFNRINTAGLDRDHCLEVALHAERSRDFRPDCGGYSVGLSSGTSGNRGMFVTSPGEQAEWAGYIIGKMLPARPRRQRVALFLRSNNNLYEASSGFLLAFKYFDMLRPLTDLIGDLSAWRPDVLIAPPTLLRVLADAGVPIAPARIISAAEVLEPYDRTAIEEAFGCMVHQVYQCTEGFLACTCRLGNLHLNEDIVIVEKAWLDRDSGRFNPIITDLRRSTQPVVRYRLDDVLIENIAQCECGSAFTRIEAIEGRNDDILWLPSEKHAGLLPIYPDVVRRAMLLHRPSFDDYRIIQRGPIISVSIRGAGQEAELRGAITAELDRLFQGLGARRPEIHFDEWVPPEAARKCRRVQCLQKPDENTAW